MKRGFLGTKRSPIIVEPQLPAVLPSRSVHNLRSRHRQDAPPDLPSSFLGCRPWRFVPPARALASGAFVYRIPGSEKRLALRPGSTQTRGSSPRLCVTRNVAFSISDRYTFRIFRFVSKEPVEKLAFATFGQDFRKLRKSVKRQLPKFHVHLERQRKSLRRNQPGKS